MHGWRAPPSSRTTSWWPASSSTRCSSARPWTLNATRGPWRRTWPCSTPKGWTWPSRPRSRRCTPAGSRWSGSPQACSRKNGRVRPGRAYFGQKDAQQLTLVQRMVADLNFPVEIVPVPIVRSPDGLALSSRNRFLSAAEREAALVLSRALRLVEERANAHEPLDLDSARALVESQPLVELDYFDVVDPRTLEP